MVVNQEQGEGGANGKVQCILISRAQEARDGRLPADGGTPPTATTTSSLSSSSSSSCPHGSKKKEDSRTGPLNEVVPPAAAPAPNGSKVGVALANKSEVSPVQNGTTAKEGSSNAEVKSEAPAALNGNKPLFEFKFDGPLKIRTSGEKGGMHEISLLQYDKMDRKERIKTGYSLGK